MEPADLEERIWVVHRMDIHGSEYRMQPYPLTKKEADEMVDKYEAKGHHQFYFAMKKDDEPKETII